MLDLGVELVPGAMPGASTTSIFAKFLEAIIIFLPLGTLFTKSHDEHVVNTSQGFIPSYSRHGCQSG